MKIVNADYVKVHGKYYLYYQYGDGFKRYTIFKWSGIFTNIHSTVLARKCYGNIIIGDGNITLPFTEEGVATFEFEDDDVFSQIEFDLITANL